MIPQSCPSFVTKAKRPKNWLSKGLSNDSPKSSIITFHHTIYFIDDQNRYVSSFLSLSIILKCPKINPDIFQLFLAYQPNHTFYFLIILLYWSLLPLVTPLNLFFINKSSSFLILSITLLCLLVWS